MYLSIVRVYLFSLTIFILYISYLAIRNKENKKKPRKLTQCQNKKKSIKILNKVPHFVN